MSSPRKAQTVDIQLACEHWTIYPKPFPVKGTTVFCRMCSDYFDVLDAPAQFSLKCCGCHYARKYGRDKDRVLAGASKHVIKNPDHSVKIYDGEQYVETVSQNADQGTLPFQSSVEARVTVARQNQRMLRDFVTRMERSTVTVLLPAGPVDSDTGTERS